MVDVTGHAQVGARISDACFDPDMQQEFLDLKAVSCCAQQLPPAPVFHSQSCTGTDGASLVNR